MTARGTKALLALGAAAGSVVLIGAIAAACGQSVVGGDCASGYEACNGSCVPAGACTPGGLDARADGSLDGSFDDSALDGDGSDEVDDGAFIDGKGRDRPFIDGKQDGPDGGGDGGGDGVGEVPDGCPPPPYDTPANCGACGVVCSGDTPVCKGVDDAGTLGCSSPCAIGETYCAGVCVDTTIDAFNCGACGVVCPTGLCNGGKCRGARAGHVVAIGHDYAAATPTSAVAQVVVNAVFLPPSNPVRVLGFEQWSDATAVKNVGGALDAASASSGRKYTESVVVTEADFLAQLNIDKIDVAIIYDQPSAPAGMLATFGADVDAKLTSFTQSGGVIIVLDGGSATGEMPQLMTSAGLLDVSAHTTITGKTVDVVAFADAIGIGVLTPYLAPTRSVTLTTTEAPSPVAVVVVEEPTSKGAVVVHKVVRKP